MKNSDHYHSQFRAMPLAVAFCLMTASIGSAQSSGYSNPNSSTGTQERNTTTAPHRSDTNNNLGWGDKRFVKKAAEGSQLEIALADLAAQKATNPEVRS